MMGIPERHAPQRKPVRDLGGIQKASLKGSRHPIFVELRRADRAAQDRQAIVDRVERIEDRGLILLKVPVVGERKPLEHDQEVDEGADHPARLAPHQLGHVRILFLRHDRRAGGERVAHLHEGKLLTRPEHELFGDPRKVNRTDGERAHRLEEKVPAADRVE